MSKILTLEISKKVRLKAANEFDEPTLEVDYSLNGFIHEIRVYSEYFMGFVAVNELFLKANFPTSLKTIYTAVRNAIGEHEPAMREYNNDDPNPAA